MVGAMMVIQVEVLMEVVPSSSKRFVFNTSGQPKKMGMTVDSVSCEDNWGDDTLKWRVNCNGVPTTFYWEDSLN